VTTRNAPTDDSADDSPRRAAREPREDFLRMLVNLRQRLTRAGSAAAERQRQQHRYFLDSAP